MPSVPAVIHNYGRPMKAKLQNGDVVERQDSIYVPTHRAVYPVVPYDNHFVYYDGRHIGSTLMCTCGASAGVFGYGAYKKYMSYVGERVLGCTHHLQYSKHADGST